MFTGIVEGKRRITEARRGAGSLSLALDLEGLAQGVQVGDSISVAGCCLTVDALDGSVARFHLMGETLGLTCFGGSAAGERLNVERSLRVGDRLGGHFVSGHVDGVGVVAEVVPTESQSDLILDVPEELGHLLIPKGSISIDGVSLTIAAIDGRRATVCLIPHTLEITTLGDLGEGDHVHLEMDMIGKWVQRLLPDGP